MKWLGVVGLLFFVPNVHSAVIFYEGFESGKLTSGIALSCIDKPNNFSVQSKAKRAGNYAALLIDKKDQGKRCELIPGKISTFDWGKEYWVGFSFNIPYQDYGYGIYHQNHSRTSGSCNKWGGNGFTIMRDKSGNNIVIRLIPPSWLNKLPSGSASAGTKEYYSWPKKFNQWFDIVMNFRYSEGNDGFFKVWLDGKKVVDTKGSNVQRYDGCGTPQIKHYYMKAGTYSGMKGAGAIYYDEIRIGNSRSSYEDVAPAGKKAKAAPILPPSPRSQVKPSKPLTIPENLKLEIN